MTNAITAAAAMQLIEQGIFRSTNRSVRIPVTLRAGL